MPLKSMNCLFNMPIKKHEFPSNELLEVFIFPIHKPGDWYLF